MGIARKGARRPAVRGIGAAASLAAFAALASGAVRPVAPEQAVVLASRPGAALRLALDAQARGESERALAVLAALRESAPVVADYTDLLRMRLLVAAGRWSDAVALGADFDQPGSPVEAELRELVGRAFAARGEEGAARTTWVGALGRTEDPERLARLRLEIAHSLLRSGDERGAGETYLEIFTRHPQTPADAEALAALADLERRLGPIRGSQSWRRRGDALFAQRQNEQALAAYDTALALGPASRKEGERIRQKRAHTLFRLRRYPEAVQAFDSFPARPPDRIERARAVARAGDVPRAVRALEEMAARSRSASGTEARLIAALLLEGEGEREAARRHFAEIVRSSPRSGAGATALWQLGWEAYLAGRQAEAIEHFERLAALDPDAVSRLRARYWRARAAAKAGDPGASEELARIALEYPLSYYGWRAGERLDPAQRSGAEPGAAPSIPRGRAVLAPLELERPRILLEAGLGAEARAELDRLFARARGLDDRLALAELYADAGDFHRSQRLMVDAYQEVLARAPVADSLDLWWHAWPAPFVDEVREATARRAQVDPALVYSIMREESGYRPEVLSVNGARGLLQLMPETAERLARDEAMPVFAADDLFLPRVNVALGSAYLEDLLARFSGRASAAIGSYNAGPHRVSAWLDGSQLEDDEWVEAIPFEQTRGYVKRVLRSLHAYRVLY